MNKEKHFLEAINAGEPNADLIYADWLEEQGKPEADEVRDPLIVVLRDWSSSSSWSRSWSRSRSGYFFHSGYCFHSIPWSRSWSRFCSQSRSGSRSRSRSCSWSRSGRFV